MRPGQSCPGVVLLTRLLRVRLMASMRPGQSCPGVGGHMLIVAGRGPRASMRPGQSCPGVVRGIIDGIARDVGFNEAGAIMPRSGAGAAWDESRKTIAASMRPGQSCPGVATRSTRSGSSERSRFNEAGAIMPRSGSYDLRRRLVGSPASMRPGQSCPGVGGAVASTETFARWLQ